MASKLDAIADIITLDLDKATESLVLYARFELLKDMISSITNEAHGNARGYQTEEGAV